MTPQDADGGPQLLCVDAEPTEAVSMRLDELQLPTLCKMRWPLLREPELMRFLRPLRVLHCEGRGLGGGSRFRRLATTPVSGSCRDDD